MSIRTGTSNPALGLPDFNVTHVLPAPIPLGTIAEGFDSSTGTMNEYIFQESPEGSGIGAWVKLPPRSGTGPVPPPDPVDSIITEDSTSLLVSEDGLFYIAQE